MTQGMQAKILHVLETNGKLPPSEIDFQIAYQTRIAIDRIKFAIKQTELADLHENHLREAGIQLLDALDRLEALDRRFQDLSKRQSIAKGNQRLEEMVENG